MKDGLVYKNTLVDSDGSIMYRPAVREPQTYP